MHMGLEESNSSFQTFVSPVSVKRGEQLAAIATSNSMGAPGVPDFTGIWNDKETNTCM